MGSQSSDKDWNDTGSPSAMAGPPILQVILILLGAAAISSKPYFDLGASYEDMMRSVGRSQQEMREMFSGVRRGVEGLGREAEEFGDRIASDMDEELEQLGDRFGQLGHGLGDQFDLLGDHLDNLGQGLNRQFEQIGNLNFNLGRLAGPGLLDPIHASIGHNPFGRGLTGIFGRQSGAWWQGVNVCKEKEVDEEEDLVEGTQSGPFTFHMEVHSCTLTQDSYVCTHKKGGQAGFVTERTIFSCCPGHRLVSNKCTEEGALDPIEERIEELGGGEFLELLVENNLTPKLHNVTVFLPSNEAVEEWKVDNMGEGLLDGGDVNTVYRVDEGLLGRRRRSFSSSLVVMQGPSNAEVVSGHVVPGILEVSDMKDERLVPTLDKVMQPATASILDTLQSDSQFNS